MYFVGVDRSGQKQLFSVSLSVPFLPWNQQTNQTSGGRTNANAHSKRLSFVQVLYPKATCWRDCFDEVLG